MVRLSAPVCARPGWREAIPSVSTPCVMKSLLHVAQSMIAMHPYRLSHAWAEGTYGQHCWRQTRREIELRRQRTRRLFPAQPSGTSLNSVCSGNTRPVKEISIYGSPHEVYMTPMRTMSMKRALLSPGSLMQRRRGISPPSKSVPNMGAVPTQVALTLTRVEKGTELTAVREKSAFKRVSTSFKTSRPASRRRGQPVSNTL